MKKLITNLTEQYIKMEAKGKQGLRYKLYGFIIRCYKRHEGKTVSRKWFWFWGRFHLPPFWWRTKTFKIITSCMVILTVGIVALYLLSNQNAEKIVSDISLTPIERSSNGSSENTNSVESSDDRPKMYEGSLDIEETENYDFLRYDLSDAVAKNSDTVGWLTVDYCGINYPVVQGTDNDFYLKHDFYKNYNSHGWIFRDCRFNDTTYHNTVLYGHNLMVGGMFSNLSSIFDSKESVYVKFQSTSSTYIYKVVSVYTTEPVLEYIEMNFDSIEKLRKFHKDILASNQWKYAPKEDLKDDDRILTLSTCYGDNRLAVHCKLLASEIL